MATYFHLMGIDALIDELDHVRESAHLLGPQGAIAAVEAKLARKLLLAKLGGSPVV